MIFMGKFMMTKTYITNFYLGTMMMPIVKLSINIPIQTDDYHRKNTDTRWYNAEKLINGAEYFAVPPVIIEVVGPRRAGIE